MERIETRMSEFDEQTQHLLERVAVCGFLFNEKNDETSTKKARIFGKKLIDEEYIIGFAGHFSAGKSSMINALTGVNLLPSSPIPTSANIVKVKQSASDYCIIHKEDGSLVKFEETNIKNAVQSFSKDGESISLIEVGHKDSNLPKGITVMDTPGVDSTDDAHRLSTESALHLADIVFYTMDYNHVQSELNFQFTKELMRFNPNVYLIINQIDKHRESELPFSAFKKSVEDSFKLWGVEPKGIYYTSLLVPEHPHNDFDEVKSLVQNAINHREEHLLENAGYTVHQLIEEHAATLRDEMDQYKNSFEELIAEDEWQQHDELKLEADELNQKLKMLTGDSFINSFEQERNMLLNNAAISPYETRELLKSYLESLPSNFKVGFLFGAKKTIEEKEKRKLAFAQNIEKLIETQIEVHMKSLMKKSLQQAGVLSDEHALEIDAFNMTVPFDEIEKEIKVSDTITGETVLNYTERIKNVITTAFRRLTENWKVEMAELITSVGNEQTEQLSQKIIDLEKKLAILQEGNRMNERIEAFQQKIQSPSASLLREAHHLIEQWKEKEKLQTMTYQEEAAADLQLSDDIIVAESIETLESIGDTHQIIKKAKHVANSLHTVPGFLETSNYLRTKADRLDNQEFTVALFGAFSAGKSSFSNALFGEKVLPVSPNPTTATINKIRPVSPENLNRTADITLKTESRMTEDVVRSFEAIGLTVTSLEHAFESTNEALAKPLENEALHIHKSFIAAFQTGYPIYKEVLGTVLTTNQEEFEKFVAEENRSCFVDSIDFYFDCELTRQGITLVDTPGADSINARHTDVAFEYIRNADAILFVTYYNHAFGKADREFLIQLGRVKDAFELDKMFFIVNAIDLASSTEEANEVKAYVQGELQKFGIRNPRVTGISSLQALESKLKQETNSSMEQFEEAFYHFLQHDLKGIAAQAIQEETENAITRLASLISRTEMNRQRKSERLAEIQLLEEKLKEKYQQSFSEVLMKSTASEVNELIYYILQRVFLRFGDFFKEAYHPSIFVSHSTDQALKMALDETVNMLGFDVTQELKVTNLRIFQFMKNQLMERQRIENKWLQALDVSLTTTPYEPNEAEMVQFDFPFNDRNAFRSVNKLFRNQRSFFEKGEREKLRNQLEEMLKNEVEQYLQRMKVHLEKWASQYIEMEADGLQKHLLKMSLSQIDSERVLLTKTEQIEEWRKVYETIGVKELT